MEWCRLYSDIIDNQKVNELSLKNFKIFIFLLAICTKSETNGVIVDDEKIIAWRLRETEKSIKSALKIMIDLDLVIVEDGLYKIRNWERRQFKSDDVSYRVKRSRDKKKENSNVTCNVSCNKNVTPQIRAEQIQSRVDKIKEKEKAAPEHDFALQNFESFWRLYPKKVAKEDALKAFKKIKPDPALFLKIIESLKKYLPSWSANEKKYIPNAAKWLHGKRWEDEILIPLQKPEPFNPGKTDTRDTDLVFMYKRGMGMLDEEQKEEARALIARGIE